MEYVLSEHARKRLNERKIPQSVLQGALDRPTKTVYDNHGRMMIKKLYARHGKPRLLLIAGEMIGNKFKIITIIDTSKIRKYL